MGLVLGFIAALAVVGYGYLIIMQKNYLEELSISLGVTNLTTKVSAASVKAVGIYKSMQISVEGFLNFTPWKPDGYRIIYTVKHHSTFNADITAGDGLHDKERRAEAQKAKEEEASKVWNPNLTEEEKKTIEERRKSRGLNESEAAPKDELKVVSARISEVNRFLDAENRREAAASLLKRGMSRICITFGNVEMELPNGTLDDLKGKNCENYLKEIRKFVVQKVEVNAN